MEKPLVPTNSPARRGSFGAIPLCVMEIMVIERTNLGVLCGKRKSIPHTLPMYFVRHINPSAYTRPAQQRDGHFAISTRVQLSKYADQAAASMQWPDPPRLRTRSRR